MIVGVSAINWFSQGLLFIDLTIMLGSERSDWTECCQHEEEIAILQEKLIEVHNKLIDQLDICKEQELTII